MATDSQSDLPHNVDSSTPDTPPYSTILHYTPLYSLYIHSLLYTHSSQWEAITSREKEFISLASKAPVDEALVTLYIHDQVLFNDSFPLAFLSVQQPRRVTHEISLL